MTESTSSTDRPTRKLTFERIATTENSGDPVIEARLEDTGSFAIVIVTDEEFLRVANVESNRKGDMKILIDEVTEQLDRRRIWFLNPLGGGLEERLEGFERTTKPIDDPDAPQPVQEVLEGVWEPR